MTDPGGTTNGDLVHINGATTLPSNGGITGRGFVPGQSGNPGGRPRGLARAARDVVGDDGRALAEFWLAVMNDETARMTDRLAASQLLAVRGWGRPAGHAPIEDYDPLDARQAELDAAVEAFNAEVRRLAVLHDRRDGDHAFPLGTPRL